MVVEIFMTSISAIYSFGELIRDRRESNGITLKVVSEKTSIDLSLLAKIERNERRPTEKLIKQLAEFFQMDEGVLKACSISDQIAYKIIEENTDVEILKVAELKVEYLKKIKNGGKN